MFLPQLLLYPNPSDPLNGEAAALMMRDRAAYEQRVKGSNPSRDLVTWIHRGAGSGRIFISLLTSNIG